MSEVTVKPMQEPPPSTAPFQNPLPQPPPPPHRRPRVREVSSRFMTPLPSSSSSTIISPHHKNHRATSVQRQRRHAGTESSSDDDDNNSISSGSPQRKPSRAVAKLFKDHHHQLTSSSSSRSHVRPGTPIIATTTPSAPSTRLRLTTLQRSSSAAAKLLQSSGMSMTNLPSNPNSSSNDCRPSDAGGDDHDRDDDDSDSKSLPDLRSWMPEPVSSRLLVERSINRLNVANALEPFSSKLSASTPCSRSLNLPRSGSENSVFYALKQSEKAASKQQQRKVTGGLVLPPVPPYAKRVVTDGGGGGAAATKGRKGWSHQEDVHSLRMLHNRYLQWRYVNAKAHASAQALTRETERTMYWLGVEISGLYDSVTRKRIELSLLKRWKTLSTILEAQMPYLEEWSALEENYLVSLSEAIQALLNASYQIPIGGNVRADAQEVEEALTSAVKLMGSIAFHLQCFMPKAEKIENLISELARVTGGERACIEECGDLLTSANKFQVEECSLRGQLIQLHHCRRGQLV